jgi:hypothetical protein
MSDDSMRDPLEEEIDPSDNETEEDLDGMPDDIEEGEEEDDDVESDLM